MITETSVTPPDTDHDDGEGDDHAIGVFLSITEADATHRATNALIQDDTDDAIADGLVACLRAIAAHRGPGLQLALAKRLTIH